MELSQDSSWQLLPVQDYRLQKAKQLDTNSAKNAEITIDVTPKNKSQSQPEISTEIGTIVGLSHKEIQALTDSTINTIRSKASLGKSITTKDGFTYRYDKDPQVLKWVRV